MIAYLRDLARDDSGTALVEYALVVAFVSIASYGALMLIGTTLEKFFASNSTNLANVAERPR